MAASSLYNHSSETTFDVAGSSVPYFGIGLTALAYAVDHNKTGAAEGWARVSGASNFASILAGSGMQSEYVYAVAPRVPLWLQGTAVNEWVEIASTSLSSQPVMSGPSGSGSPQGKQDAWCGWHVDPRTGKVYSAGQGGHDDYWGNEFEELDLSVSAPAWNQVVATTLTGNVTTNNEYYADGKPASVHGYHTSIFIESLNRAMRFPGGARSKSGNPMGSITAFNVATGAWDTSWTLSSPASVGAGNGAYAKHPVTENVYAWFYNSQIARWNVGNPGSWTTLISSPSNPAPFYTAAACDPTRGTGAAGEVFFLGGGDGGDMCRVYDIGANSLRTITLTGTDIKANDGIGLVYVAATDKYYACIPSSGGNAVYVITPTSGSSWSCSLLSTTGGGSLPDTSSNSAYYPFTKFLYLPTVGGCIFGPRWTANTWFLKLHEV
jgi:hypothetical protein